MKKSLREYFWRIHLLAPRSICIRIFMDPRGVVSRSAAYLLALIVAPHFVAINAATADTACPQVVHICQYNVCDGEGDPATSPEDKPLGQVDQGSRHFVLHFSPTYQMVWASIENGAPGDVVWLDRSFDAGKCWEPWVSGVVSVPEGQTGWRTMMYSTARGTAQLRACGHLKDMKDIKDVVCTPWLPVCENGACDGRDPAGVRERGGNGSISNPEASSADGPKVILHIADSARMAWASIENGSKGDEVWIDRLWSGQDHWDRLLDRASIPEGRTGWRTWMFHFDDLAHRGFGSLRACAKYVRSNEVKYTCTKWIGDADLTDVISPRSPVRVAPRHAQAVKELIHLYSKQLGGWNLNQEQHWWWQSANALTTIIEFMLRTGDNQYAWIINHLYSRHVSQQMSEGHYKDFNNLYMDDSAWWGLAWIRAYDLTGDTRYLGAARTIAEWIWNKGWDTKTCNGGIWWQASPKPAMPNDNEPPAKNAIATELFIKLAASIHNRVSGETVQLERALTAWGWFKGSPFLSNPKHIVYDALYDKQYTDCVHPRFFWSYSQGVVLGAIAELYRALPAGPSSDKTNLITQARTLVESALDQTRADARDRFVYGSSGPPSRVGVIRELCEETSNCPSSDGSNDDAPPFKGEFVRNLRELYDLFVSIGQPVDTWRAALVRQAAALTPPDPSLPDHYGFYWTGEPSDCNFSTQASAVDALTAAAF